MEEYRYLTRYTEHELRKLLPGYRKSKYNTEVLMEHIDRAIINEKKFCENILKCYKENPESWIDLVGTGLPEEDIEKCEKATRENFDEMAGKISQLLELL